MRAVRVAQSKFNFKKLNIKLKTRQTFTITVGVPIYNATVFFQKYMWYSTPVATPPIKNTYCIFSGLFEKLPSHVYINQNHIYQPKKPTDAVCLSLYSVNIFGNTVGSGTHNIRAEPATRAPVHVHSEGAFLFKSNKKYTNDVYHELFIQIYAIYNFFLGFFPLEMSLFSKIQQHRFLNASPNK